MYFKTGICFFFKLTIQKAPCINKDFCLSIEMDLYNYYDDIVLVCIGTMIHIFLFSIEIN